MICRPCLAARFRHRGGSLVAVGGRGLGSVCRVWGSTGWLVLLGFGLCRLWLQRCGIWFLASVMLVFVVDVGRLGLACRAKVERFYPQLVFVCQQLAFRIGTGWAGLQHVELKGKPRPLTRKKVFDGCGKLVAHDIMAQACRAFCSDNCP